MIYCIVEGKTDCVILEKVFKSLDITVKVITSNGFPSLPAVARTIMSYMNPNDKVMIVCDYDNFRENSYGKEMLAFLLRGAMSNPSFALFTFDPNIDHLIQKTYENKKCKKNVSEIEAMVNSNIDRIKENKTIQKIIEFVKN